MEQQEQESVSFFFHFFFSSQQQWRKERQIHFSQFCGRVLQMSVAKSAELELLPVEAMVVSAVVSP